MGRFNQTIDGVFVNIVGDSSQISSYDKFIGYGSGLKLSDEINQFTGEYAKLINENKTTFWKLSKLEEIIMQMRTMENIDDIKLSLVREYIYARCPFYRKEKTSKDIRVIVDKSEFYGEDMEKLAKDKEFMKRATEKLKKAMEIEIMDNIREYQKLK
jgi:hypothetical protein